MKYIRTKDGRIIPYKKQYDGFTKTIDERFYYINQDDVITFVHKDMILKQVDTIEELCDEFVGVRKSDNTAHLGKIKDKHWFYEQTGWVGRVENYKVIYGAIWTDKGLIYVAKMNEEGEMELL